MDHDDDIGQTHSPGMDYGSGGQFSAADGGLDEQQPPAYGETEEEEEPDAEAGEDIVQVVYQQSDSNGPYVGVESSLISGVLGYDQNGTDEPRAASYYANDGVPFDNQQPLTRPSSTLAPVTEESSGACNGAFSAASEESPSNQGPREFPSGYAGNELDLGPAPGEPPYQAVTGHQEYLEEASNHHQYHFYADPQQRPADPTPLYSTIRKNRAPVQADQADASDFYAAPYSAENEHQPAGNQLEVVHPDTDQHSLAGTDETKLAEEEADEEQQQQEEEEPDLSYLLARQKQGVAESGSFRNNFKKKLAMSNSTANENDLNAHRQKLLESKELAIGELQPASDYGHEFKRTHSVSFTPSTGRGNRHSVDIRNLPSYLTVKRASIVDVAKGAMSSLLSSLGGGSSGGGGGNRRDSRESQQDDEPIFEEPLAPTLSLGQRVALVRNSGTEFGTVGWIGQLPEVDYDWVVGVVFDNMIGDCDGAHNGVRYFYARENYAMFVPLSTLIKTDNYVGRPETGTMLSRMSVSLKPGQLISIQRSSILLQHCFLNAPHQRVGHDVRAVSNRLHCQCHNCGPCAHLTKQGRSLNHLPAFGGHHAPNKKNSLAHAAVEILAHHHHHYHEEEHKEEDYQFGDNAAHACNFVRYSCCKQDGITGHDFKPDCEMVRPELLDNLIHAPRAPITKTRLKRAIRSAQDNNQQKHLQLMTNESTLESNIKACSLNSASEDENESASSSYSGSNQSLNSQEEEDGDSGHDYPDFRHEHDTIFSQRNVYSTIDSKMSIIDQQRFIHRSESEAFSHLNDHYSERSKSLGSTIRHCFACILGRGDDNGKPKKRRMSARDRVLEYRRRQSTFVPSTLAKPQEDFVSHGLPFPGNQTLPAFDANSDCSIS